MHNADDTRKAPRRGVHTSECCTDTSCDSGLRNHYYEGKRLTADVFRVEQKYIIERRRLLNRALHGWGVVYGLGIRLHEPRLHITPGLALDECGRELVPCFGCRPGQVQGSGRIGDGLELVAKFTRR